MASSYFETPSIRIVNSNLVSTLVSVGLHGLALFLLVPYVTNLPSSEPEESDKGPIDVPLIELNPNEQSRLPEQNAGLSTMPEFPNSSLGDLPVLDSPSLGSSFPNNFSNLPSPPALPALPPLPPLPSYNNYSRIPIALPPRRSFTPPPPIRRTPLPPPSLQTPTPKTPPVPDEQTPPINDPRQNIDFSDPTPVKPNNPLFQRPNDQNPLANNPRLPVRPNNKDQIIRNLLEDTLKGADSLTYNPQGTKREEARRRDLEWMQQTGVTLKPTQIMRIKGTYPKAACNLKLEGTAIYNVLVNDNGQLRKPPFLTQSSGYGLLNNQGLQQIRSLSFPQSTRVKVIFQYDPKICGTGVAEGERNNQPQVSPSSTPKTPTQPSPSPVPQTPQNQIPLAPTEPKTPASAPENSNNPTPKIPTEPLPSAQPSPVPQTPQNQTPKAPTEPKTPTPVPENSNNATPKIPTEPLPSAQPSTIPQTPQNQTPKAPTEPKTPTPVPENSNNATPKIPTESKPKPPTQPSPVPQTPQNQTPLAPAEPKTNPNSSSNTKLDGVAAPPAGKK